MSNSPGWFHDSHRHSHSPANGRNRDPRRCNLLCFTFWIKGFINSALICSSHPEMYNYSILTNFFQISKVGRRAFIVQTLLGHWSQGKNQFGNILIDLWVEAESFYDNWHLRHGKDCPEEALFFFPLRHHHGIFLKYEIKILNVISDFMHWQIKHSSSLCYRNIVIKCYICLKVAVVPLSIPCCGSRWFTLESSEHTF